MVLYSRYQQGQSSPAGTEDRQMTKAQELCEAFRAECAANPTQKMARWAARQTAGFEILSNQKWMDGQRKWVRCPDGSRFGYTFGDALVRAEAWAAPAETEA
jgi:hypothetical protein